MNLRRSSLVTLLAFSLLTSVVAATQADNQSVGEENGGHGKIEFPLEGGAAVGLVNHSSFKDNAVRNAGTATVGQYGIQYHNGPILNAAGGVNVYVIWYGNWGTDTAKTILPTFISGLSNSPYFAINSTYTDAAGVAPTARVNLAGQYSYATTTLGTKLTDANVLSLAKGSLGLGTIPSTVDPNALYFVLTATGISESSGFLTKYCGWHSSETMDYLNTVPTPAVAPATDMKYSFVGNPGTNKACIGQTQTTYSPNSNVGADAMTSVIAHELEETVTDPDGTAWWNSTTGAENGDQCAWKFGTTSTLSSTTTLTGSVTSVSNNSATNTATVTAATNNGIVSATLSKIASNATGNTVTFTTTASSGFVVGDKVTLPANLPAPFTALSSTVQSITAVSTANRTYTFAISVTPSVTANTSVTFSGAVTVNRVGTTITFTNSGTNAFAVGDKVSVAAPSPYSVSGASITARTNTSFTVSVSVPANTATVTGLNIVATATRASTTATYTYTPAGAAFIVGDKVSVTPSVSAYTLNNVAITAVTSTSFTVSLALPAGTAGATLTSTTATVTRTASSLYNMTLGGLNFLVQQNWANRSPSGVCALS